MDGSYGMHASQNFNNNNSPVNTFSRPSTSKGFTSSVALKLEDTSSLRRGKSWTELRNCGNLGPGSYDFQPSIGALSRPQSKYGRSGGGGGGMSKSHVSQQFSIIKPTVAPPIGTYDLPRIMSPNVPGSEIGVRISSPFKSNGGRNKTMLLDGEHYATLREDITLSNMGPGYYECVDKWKPSAFVKYNKPRSRNGGHSLAAMSEMNKSFNSITTKDKPWRGNSVLGSDGSKKTDRRRAVDPFDTSETDQKLMGPHRRSAMLRKDIDAVKDLPNYQR